MRSSASPAWSGPAAPRSSRRSTAPAGFVGHGLIPRASGCARVRCPVQSRGHGLAPEERKSQALFLRESIATNMTAASLRRYSRFGFVNHRRELADANQQVRSLDIRPHDARRRVVTLSGGNQQKVVVGRWLMHGCRLLLLDEPTRGVDVGARAELYALIRGAGRLWRRRLAGVQRGARGARPG